MNVDEVIKFLSSLNLAGHGVARVAYKINELPLVIKISFETGNRHRQSRREVARIAEINSNPQYAHLRANCPKLYWSSPDASIMLMHWYPPVDKDDPEARRMSERFRDFGVEGIESYATAIGRDESGALRVFDLGCWWNK